MATKSITDENFEAEVIQSDKLTVVDFWAPWCGPCKMIAPVLEELSEKYEDDIKILKLNVDENIATAQNYRVMSIPNIKFFKDGQMVDEVIGAVPKEEFEKRIESLK